MTTLEQRVLEMVDRNRLPHGLLFVGSRNTSKNHVALALSQKIVCTSDPDQRPCQTCISCQNAQEGNHPDVRTVVPEKQEITIDQIRDLQRWVHIGPYEAPQKIALVHEAHTLNIAAANALLKTLEEPPSHAIIILTTNSPDQLPRTVHSRLMVIRFPENSLTSESEEETPDWLGELQLLLESPPPLPPEKVFEFTQRLAKNRNELRFFFQAFEQTLRNRLERSSQENWTLHERQSLEDLFDRTLEAESRSLRRYANIALNLDHLLLTYSALPRR